MRTAKKMVTLAVLVASTVGVQAALINRGGGMIYDSTRNITWLADMNYAKTSGHTGTGVNADGSMVWAAATDWANNLAYGGYSDWRLPTLNPGDTTCTDNGGQVGFGWNCTGGELSGLFVTDLGNKRYQSVLNQTSDTPGQIANLALFSNVQATDYWSGTEYAPFPPDAWFFGANSGVQTRIDKRYALYSVAVRPGDVAVTPQFDIPEPGSLALVALSLGLAFGARRYRQG